MKKIQLQEHTYVKIRTGISDKLIEVDIPSLPQYQVYIDRAAAPNKSFPTSAKLLGIIRTIRVDGQGSSALFMEQLGCAHSVIVSIDFDRINERLRIEEYNQYGDFRRVREIESKDDTASSGFTVKSRRIMWFIDRQLALTAAQTYGQHTIFIGIIFLQYLESINSSFMKIHHILQCPRFYSAVVFEVKEFEYEIFKIFAKHGVRHDFSAYIKRAAIGILKSIEELHKRNYAHLGIALGCLSANTSLSGIVAGRSRAQPLIDGKFVETPPEPYDINYCPPEFMKGTKQRLQGKSFDIWSMVFPKCTYIMLLFFLFHNIDNFVGF
jgi:hypothetical protein